MIDPKELRIGNFVNEHYESGDVLPIEWTLTNFHWLAAAGGEESYSPIQITPEWLRRLELDEREGSRWVSSVEGLNVNQQKIIFDGIEEVFYYITNKYYIEKMSKDIICVIADDIRHVHQLQNLYFALTGEELKLTT